MVDDFTRECLAAVADTSISGARVARELDALVAWRGHPQTIVSDNGTYREQKDAWFVDAVAVYCAAVGRLAAELASLPLRSRGLQLFRDYLRSYTVSARFISLRNETDALQRELARIQYSLLIKDASIWVRPFDQERDYAAEVAATFAQFARDAPKDYLVKFNEFKEMNHIEAGVLGCVAKLFPASFARLSGFPERHRDYADETIVEFDREIQFYLAYLEYIAPLRRAGLKFGYPCVSTGSKTELADSTFDLALAAQLVRQDNPVVCNDFSLNGRERVIVVTGPNQGGKTTFARMFGQLHYLASLGLLVPGENVEVFLFDELFTHFERQELARELQGKLEDDLRRIHEILSRATPSSVIVLNEIFTSTTLADALFLSRRILERIMRLDTLCVCVTFIDELASLGEQTVSMVSTVAADDPARRTYKILRRPADGLAYAMTIAEKYRLTYDCLRGRTGR